MTFGSPLGITFTTSPTSVKTRTELITKLEQRVAMKTRQVPAMLGNDEPCDANMLQARLLGSKVEGTRTMEMLHI